MKTFFSEFTFSQHLRSEPAWKAGEIERRLERIQINTVTEGATVIRALAQKCMLDGHGIDYFIETRDLADLLISAVSTYTAAVLDVFQESRNFAIVIHPPSPMKAVLVGMLTIYGEPYVVINEDRYNGQAVILGPSSFATQKRIEAEHPAVKLAIGLAVYVSRFPHAVRDGVPEIAKHPNHYRKSRAISVGTVPELIDRSGPKPHIRAAHIRFLGHQRFTHKRNTQVWVGTAFVNGRSKVVMEIEDEPQRVSPTTS